MVRWLSVVSALVVLAASAPGPVGAVHQLAHPAATDPVAPLVAAVALTAWLLAGWLLLALAATTAGRLPGALGRAAAAAARRLAPAAVRRVLEAALGMVVATSALGAAAPASAADAIPRPVPPAPRPAAELSLDWPGTASPPALDWVQPAASVGPSPSRPTPPPPSEPVVVVRPDDSLWSIAAGHLAAPSPGAIARSWPRWWSANRDVIGSDPDLIHPGTRLVPPAR